MLGGWGVGGLGRWGVGALGCRRQRRKLRGKTGPREVLTLGYDFDEKICIHATQKDLRSSACFADDCVQQSLVLRAETSIKFPKKPVGGGHADLLQLLPQFRFGAEPCRFSQIFFMIRYKILDIRY